MCEGRVRQPSGTIVYSKRLIPDEPYRGDRSSVVSYGPGLRSEGNSSKRTACVIRATAEGDYRRCACPLGLRLIIACPFLGARKPCERVCLPAGLPFSPLTQILGLHTSSNNNLSPAWSPTFCLSFAVCLIHSPSPWTHRQITQVQSRPLLPARSTNCPTPQAN